MRTLYVAPFKALTTKLF